MPLFPFPCQVHPDWEESKQTAHACRSWNDETWDPRNRQEGERPEGRREAWPFGGDPEQTPWGQTINGQPVERAGSYVACDGTRRGGRRRKGKEGKACNVVGARAADGKWERGRLNTRFGPTVAFSLTPLRPSSPEPWTLFSLPPAASASLEATPRAKEKRASIPPVRAARLLGPIIPPLALTAGLLLLQARPPCHRSHRHARSPISLATACTAEPEPLVAPLVL
jgi:hypothetical protein